MGIFRGTAAGAASRAPLLLPLAAIVVGPRARLMARGHEKEKDGDAVGMNAADKRATANNPTTLPHQVSAHRPCQPGTLRLKESKARIDQFAKMPSYSGAETWRRERVQARIELTAATPEA